MTRDLHRVLAYHERSAHRPGRYAASLGYLDWATQPNPFRLYEGAERLPLARPEEAVLRDRPTYGDLFAADAVAPWPMGSALLSSILYHALALAAWKQSGRSRWSLRVNPSSGNLHPTEAYVIAGALAEGGRATAPGLYHYTPLLHALERRGDLAPGAWEALGLGDDGVLVGLSSIAWREAWKYGERSFRYCNHDVGHAIAALAFAAALHGWQAALVDPIAEAELAAILGLEGLGAGVEAERAECLIALTPRGRGRGPALAALAGLTPTSLHGRANQLSEGHHEWAVLDEIAAATEVPASLTPRLAGPPEPRACDLEAPAAGLLRGRRSAVAMDGRTGIESHALYDMLLRTLPGGQPLAALPWRPAVDLALMIHRVAGVDPGLYLLVRGPEREARWRAALPEAAWEAPPGCSEGLPLRRLVTGDARRAAARVSCAQDIAADGAFALAMFVDLPEALERGGPWVYRRLFWESGALGQLLYLEAEALGIAATGIGCFFDAPTRALLGLAEGPGDGDGLRSLYHFTIGGRVDDPRLRTLDAYEHLADESTGPGSR
ncbi:MAG: SagB/ThcOx family dehydrogenase [Nannocystaceae bacterium]